MTLGIALALALSVPMVASAATIKVDEQDESATFVNGGNTPKNYFDRIKDLSNHNLKCSLREAIEASNTDKAVDGCPAGDGPGDVVVLPAGTYPVYDNLFVRERVIVRGANAGTPGNDPNRGAETIIKFVFNPQSQAQVGMFWLGDPSPNGPADGGGSEFDGLTLEGNSNPLCAVEPPVAGTCEEWAIVQPEKSGGGANTAPGLQLRNSIVRDFTSGVYLGGKGAVIARNLFEDNDALLNDPRGVNSGVDVYSDAVYTNIDPVVVRNVFANPAVTAVEYQGYISAEKVSGGLIRGNLVNMHLPAGVPANGRGQGRFGIFLLNTQGQRIQDNVIQDASPPAVAKRTYPYGVLLDGIRNLEISGNTFTGLGTSLRVTSLGVPFAFSGVSGVRVANNRIYGNRYGIRVFLPQEPLSIDARANWWGANGGAGSNGARPDAPNPVNGVLFENGTAPPGAIDTTDPLQLTCSMPATVTANTPVPLTGRVAGMPSVDRTASTSPWFESIHDPLMGAGISGVPGTTSGFDQPPSQGVLGGQVIAGGGSLTGTLVATSPGTGAGQVALDSEQVACPFTVTPGPEAAIDKDADSPTVIAGGLAGYRITVTDRGRVTARNWWVCDPIPRGMTFVRATRKLRRLRQLRCLVIPRLRPHQRVSFHLTLRVASNAASGTMTNIAEVIPGLPPGIPGGGTPGGGGTPAGGGTPPALVPIGKDRTTVKVRRPVSRPPAPPPVTG